MTSSCPHCGTHIGSIADAKDTIIGPAPAPQQRDSEQPSGSQQPSGANPVSPHLDSGKEDLDSNKDDLDLSTKQNRTQLKRLICKCPCYGGSGEFAKYLSFRQYLCVGYLGAAKPGRPRQALDRTTTKMHDAICRTGEVSVDDLFASRLLGLSSLYICFKTVFQAIGAIVYDMEWTNDDGELVFQNAEALADAKHTPSVQTSSWAMMGARPYLSTCFSSTMGIQGFQSSDNRQVPLSRARNWTYGLLRGFLVFLWRQHGVGNKDTPSQMRKLGT